MSLRSLVSAPFTCVFLTAAAAPTAAEPCPVERVDRQSDRTGSLELTVRLCAADGLRGFALDAIAKPAGARARLFAGELSTEEAPYGAARLFDLDGDGQLELEVVGSCSAGPNCDGTVYRRTGKSDRFDPLFHGGYATLQIVDGHLVVGGRASCCSWEYRAYPFPPDTRRIDEGRPSYRIDVSTEGDDEKPDVTCTFFDLRAGEPRLIAPPGPAWTSICETYGAVYRVVLQASDSAPK